MNQGLLLYPFITPRSEFLTKLTISSRSLELAISIWILSRALEMFLPLRYMILYISWISFIFSLVKPLLLRPIELIPA